LKAFRSAVAAVKGILTDLNDVKADKLRTYWNDAYDVEQIMIRRGPLGQDVRWEYIWRQDPNSSIGFDKVNSEITLAIRKVLGVYYNK